MQQPMKACIHVVTDFVRVLSLAGTVEQAVVQRVHNACVHVLSDLLSYMCDRVFVSLPVPRVMSIHSR